MQSNHFRALAAILVLVCAGSALSQLCAAEGRNTAIAADMHSSERGAGGLTLAESGEAANGDKPASNTISFDIIVKDGRLVSKRRVLVVHRNDDVILRITSDAADQFHLHGYNMLVDLAPGRMTMLRFKANLTGRFTYELHKTDLELGALEVYP
jgi:heme/copper-type cytochrome/quinol oxidase subunit 2